MSLLTVKLFVNVITLTVQTELVHRILGAYGASRGRAVAALQHRGVAAARRPSRRQSSVARQKQRARVSACTRGSRRSRWTTRVATGGPRGGRAARGACAARSRRRSTSSTATGSSRARAAPPPPPPPHLHSPTGLTVVELE